MQVWRQDPNLDHLLCYAVQAGVRLSSLQIKNF